MYRTIEAESLRFGLGYYGMPFLLEDQDMHGYSAVLVPFRDCGGGVMMKLSAYDMRKSKRVLMRCGMNIMITDHNHISSGRSLIFTCLSCFDAISYISSSHAFCLFVQTSRTTFAPVCLRSGAPTLAWACFLAGMKMYINIVLVRHEEP